MHPERERVINIIADELRQAINDQLAISDVNLNWVIDNADHVATKIERSLFARFEAPTGAVQ
jgi:hypothetical protein